MSSTRCTPWLGVTILRCVGAVHVHDVVDEAAGGVHHAAGLDRVLLAREVVDELHAGRRVPASSCRMPVTVAWLTTVPPFSTQVCARLIGHARVVELPVVVDHAALQPLFDRGGDVFHHLLRRDELRTSVAEAEREQVVERQAAEVEEIVPVAVVRDDERLVLHQMRGVGLHAAAFAQRLEHQHHVAFLEVAHAAVHEFGRTARRAFGEVGLFEAALRSCPRVAASTATPSPVAPPPTTTMSQILSFSDSFLICASSFHK